MEILITRSGGMKMIINRIVKRIVPNRNFDIKALYLNKVKSKEKSLPKVQSKTLKKLDSIQLYLHQIGTTPLLTPEEELYFSRLALKGDRASRERMINSNLRLVVKIARRYINSSLSFLDLIEEGNIGLMRAVDKFDPEKGFRFSTYATWWIRQSIERGIMNQGRTIRLPVHVAKELNVYLRASRELSQTLDHKPTPKEIAHYLGRNEHNIKKVLAMNESISSVDKTIGSGSDLTLLDMVADENSIDPSVILQQQDVKNSLSLWLNQLNDNQCEVISRRFGLLGHDMSTLEKVGHEIGLTRERVRQIQIDALKRLREIMESHGLNSKLMLESHL